MEETEMIQIEDKQLQKILNSDPLAKKESDKNKSILRRKSRARKHVQVGKYLWKNPYYCSESLGREI